MCGTSYANLIPTETPYNPGTTNTYAGGGADYESIPDASLTGANTAQGGKSANAFNLHIGMGEIITPQTGSTFGSPNNHSFKVNTITVPLAGSAASASNYTLNIYDGTVTGALTGDTTTTFTPTSTLFSDTFTWSAHASSTLDTFTLANGPTLALDHSYLVSLEWDSADQAAGTNAVVWYRNVGSPADPGGQGMLLNDADTGKFITIAAAGAAGGSPRNFALAINAVPEPGTLILMGLAAPALALAARRRKA
jgi:hypothetical protein